MIQPFWDDNCPSFSNKLWKPPFPRTFSLPKWESEHPLLPIRCFSRGSHFPNIRLLPVTLYDNSKDKLMKFNKLFGAELGRLARLFEKKKIKLPFLIQLCYEPQVLSR